MATGTNAYNYGQAPIAQKPQIQAGNPQAVPPAQKPMPQEQLSTWDLVQQNKQQFSQTPGGLYGNIGGTSSTGLSPHSNVQVIGAGGKVSGGGSPQPTFRPGQQPEIPINQEYIDNAYAAALRQMEPQMQQQQREIEGKLVARGLTPGTAAYQQEMDRMSRSQNDMLQSAAYGAQQVGLGAQNQAYQQQYGYDQLANQLQQAQIGAAAQRAAAAASANASKYGAGLRHELGMAQLGEQGRQFDISDIYRTQGQDQQFLLGLGNLLNQSAGMGINQFNAQNNANNMWYQQAGQMANNAPGVMFNPQMDYTSNQIGANQNRVNAIGQDNAMMAQFAGGALGMFSDMRLKENIKPVGKENGVNMYEFEYKDKTHGAGRYRGVMAQEVRHDYPDAVITGLDGHMRVDYSQLPVDMTLISEVTA